MSIWLLGLCLAVVCLPSPAGAQTAWERYLMMPTPENAREVRALAYSDSADNVDRLLDDLQLLEDQMQGGDTAAVRLAFQLERKADGVYGETLNTMIGRLVRINPALFLQNLRRVSPDTRRDSLPKGWQCGLARVGAPEFVDRFDAASYESRMRMASLRRVTNPGLRKIRDQCIADLRLDATKFGSRYGAQKP